MRWQGVQPRTSGYWPVYDECGSDMPSFAGKNVVGAGCRGSVHDFDADARFMETLEKSGMREALIPPRAQYQDLWTRIEHELKMEGFEALETRNGPYANRLREEDQAAFQALSIDRHIPFPVPRETLVSGKVVLVQLHGLSPFAAEFRLR